MNHSFLRLFFLSVAFVLAFLGSTGKSIYSQTTLTYTSSGSWTVPCGVTFATITICGGGGGGGGDAVNGFPAGSGGGSGAYVQYLNLPVTSGNVYNFTVGAAGAGASGANGIAGGSTTFNGPGVALTASGGAGGGANGGAGGNGGLTATGGTTNTVGISGETATAAMIVGGYGAGSPNGGGNVASCGTNGCSGTIGSLYGGGGSGGGPRGGGANSTGGAGRQGVVIITYTSTVTQPNAGADKTQCGAIGMTGNAPSAGWTGTWSVVSGTATILAPNNPNTPIVGIPSGTCATLRWTFSMAGCPSVSDDVILCNPVSCNDNACIATPLTVNTSCTYSTYNSTGATLSNSMPEPGCGSFADNDVWFSAVVPANGQIQFSGVDAAGGGSYYVGMAVYNGSCNNLMHHGCDYTTSTITPATLVYNGTPGETVYLRVWDYLDTEGSFQLCAFTHSNATGSVLPGSTTITCGGPAQIWMDPGGTGNYENETNAFYEICPSVPGQFVTVNFTSFNIENGFDYLTVMNGGGSFDPIIGNYTGATLPPTITSSAADGCLSFQFRTDNIGNAAGWNASVTCSPTAGTNTVICTSTNCAGNCGQWVCQDGLYPTDNQGSASVEEITEQTGGCFGGIGEISTKWFYFTALTTGTVGITFDGPGGMDYDFAVWGPSPGGVPVCPSNTGSSPIRCSYSAAANPVGLGNGATDYFEDAAGDGWIAPLNVIAGETYSLILNIFQNGNPQPTIDISFTGSGTLDCTPVNPLPVELLSFMGTYSQGFNRLQWESATELNNDYYTLFYSEDAMNWKTLNVQNGAGNSNIALGYSHSHISPYEVTYYKLRQTDYDGNFREFGPISIAKGGSEEQIFVNVYPNPAHGELHINVSHPGNLTYHLFDNLGREVINSIGGNTGTDVLDIYNLPAGLYQIVVESGAQVVYSGKVVVK